MGCCGVVYVMYLRFSSGHFPQELVSGVSIVSTVVASIVEDDRAMCLCVPSLVPCECHLSDYSLHDVYGRISTYIDLSLIRDPLSGGEGVQCHTDLTTCCSSDQGMDRGDWYAPGSEDRLPLESEEDSDDAIYECRGNQSVTLLQRKTAESQPAGIYCCDIYYNSSQWFW